MTLCRPMFPPRAGRAHALKSRRPRSVRPRFKTGYTAAQEAILPPSIEPQVDMHPYWGAFDAVAAAARDGHPLATLLRLRQEAADQVERLLRFLDLTEGDVDAEALDEPTAAEIRKVGTDIFMARDVDDEDGADDEPSLGWARGGAIGCTFDLEET